jgi:plastocyanin
MLRGRTVVLMMLVGLTAVACGGSGAPKTTVAGLKVNSHGTKVVTGATTIPLEADSYYFSPTVLKGTPGQQVTLNIKNDTGVQHNFTLKAQQIDKDFSGDVTINVTFPQSGVLSFYCKYHKTKGMGGALLVSGNASG